MPHPRTVVAAGGAIAIAALATRSATRHLTHGPGHHVEGGILVDEPGAYDRMSRLLFGRMFDGIAADVARVAPHGARVLEVGSGPGLLAIRLAAGGLDVTGVDLDGAMVERAIANAHHAADAGGTTPTFLVGNAASLPFADASFDVVVSTFSMHHWDDPSAGLTEIARVLRPGGRALIWDLRPGGLPIHRETPDPRRAVDGSPLTLADSRAWRWPGPVSLAQRLELVAPASAAAAASLET